jgi:hypothetical protein
MEQLEDMLATPQWSLLSRVSGSKKSSLYGIWEVEQLSIDAQPRAPLVTDSDRWWRVFFDSPDHMAIQRMDDSFAHYGASISACQQGIPLDTGIPF